MLRTLEITVGQDKTDALVVELGTIQEIQSLKVQRGISVKPQGDVISITTTNSGMHQILTFLQEKKYLTAGLSVTTGMSLSIVSSTLPKQFFNGPSTVTFEEMETLIARESNMTFKALGIMAIGGFMAAFGIATSVLHYVIAAMLIVPGFEPITRMGLGVAKTARAFKKGLMDTLSGYGALIAGAAFGSLVLRLLGINPLQTISSYLPAHVLLVYWTNISASSVIVSAIVSIAGSLLLLSNRSVLTAGVMVALALVPSAALVGVSLVELDFVLVQRSLLRWLIDLTLVFIVSAVVFRGARFLGIKKRLFL